MTVFKSVKDHSRLGSEEVEEAKADCPSTFSKSGTQKTRSFLPSNSIWNNEITPKVTNIII